MRTSNRTAGFRQDGKPIRRQAAEWLARRQGGFAAGEQFEFDRWLAADPRHRAALAEMESAWNLINAPVAAGKSEELRSGLMAHVQRRTLRRQRPQSCSRSCLEKRIRSMFPRSRRRWHFVRTW